MIDDVTGLPSEPHLFERLEEELDRGRRYGRPLAVMMLDIDCLRTINEETHRLFGSYVLREVGELLSRNLRRCDTVFRFESDEFVAILPETTPEGAMVAAERARRLIESHRFESPPWAVQVTVSVGVTGSAGTSDETARSIVRSVDVAVDAAKRDGRNRCAMARPVAPV